ncbi:MAG: FHA domain-containing protein [Polyangia bacterium]
MSSQPSGPGDGKGAESSADADLDAELDRAVPVGEAQAFLIAINGDHPGRVYGLTRNTVIIGRNDGVDVAVTDPSVSGHHARIINGSDGFEIEDLSSTNGTFLHGERIKRARLKNGDRLLVGTVEFTFLLDRRADATIALIAPQKWATAPAPAGALVRLPQPSPRLSHSSQFPPPLLPVDDEQGASFAEVVHKVVALYRFVQHHFRLIAIMLCAGVGLGLVSMFILPPPRSAFCEVKLQPQMKSNPVETERNTDDSLQFFRGAEHAFTHPELVRSTILTLDGVDPDESRVGAITSRLRFEPMDEHTYRATYHDGLFGRGRPAPDVFLDAHLRNYLQSEIKKALRVFSAEADFLRNQLKTVEKDLQQIAAERTRFREANADRLPEESLQTHSSRFALESRRAELVAQVRRLQGELDAQKRDLSNESPLAQSRFQASQVYRDSLASVNKKLSEAYASGLAEGHPQVLQLKEEKSRIENLINEEMRSQPTQMDRESNAGLQGLSNRVATLQAQLGAARSDLGDTERSLGQVRKVVGDLPRVEERVQELNHTQEATNRLHSQLFEKLKKAELQLSIERVSAESRYDIITAPRLEKGNTAKALALRTGIGLFLGLALAAVVIAFIEGRRVVANTLASVDYRRPPFAR